MAQTWGASLDPANDRIGEGRGLSFIRGVVIWFLFFLTCLGLGYPTLNRYDPRQTGNVDSAQYYQIVVGSPVDAIGHWRYRVLVPYLAKPIYWLAKGRVGSWDPVFVGLLVVNSAFVASTAFLLISLCRRIISDPSVALLSGCLYLLNFAVANEQLAGLVDSSEAFLLMALVWVLFQDQWYLLPLLGVAGGLAKETSVPLAVCLAIVWWIVRQIHGKGRTTGILWIAAMALCGLGGVSTVHSLISGSIVWPWVIASSEASDIGLFKGLAESVFSQDFWYVFVWLLPLGIWQLKNLPREWVLASLASAGLALLLGAYNNAGGNTARAMFNAAGPMLSVSGAVTLSKLISRANLKTGT